METISQTQITPTNETTHFYGYDGHGNVRLLLASNGVITDTYDYEGFGNLITRSGTTVNHLLYCGEYLDPDLGLYFLRARYMETDRGRFWTMDVWEGLRHDPLSLHKYLYAHANPASYVDPSGQWNVTDIMLAVLTIGVVQLAADVLVYKVAPPLIEWMVERASERALGETVTALYPPFGGFSVGSTGSFNIRITHLPGTFLVWTWSRGGSSVVTATWVVDSLEPPKVTVSYPDRGTMVTITYESATVAMWK